MKCYLAKAGLLFLANIAFLITINAQENPTVSTQGLAGDLKKLIELNSTTPNIIDFSGKEAVNISSNATATQITELTARWLSSEILNAKGVCLHLLSEALFKKAESQKLRQEITEMLCKNYLHNRDELQMVDNILLQLKEKDFNSNSKRYIAALIDTVPKFDYDICAKLLAIAQVKESIPVLWKIANKTVTTMGRGDLDVLASLARLNEREAGVLLCNYYNSIKSKPDYKHVFASRELAFSLDKTVLNCLVSDFKTIDINIKYREGDTGYWPSQYLGAYIAGMLKNYPYPKQEFYVDPKQLSDWLNEPAQYELDKK